MPRRRPWAAAAILVPLICVSLWPGLYRGWVTWRHVGASLVASTGTLVVRDFVDFWGGAHLALAGHGLRAFDPAGFAAWLQHRFAPATDVNTWSYPPSLLLLVAPLGAFGLLPGYAIWLVATLALLVFALRGHGFGTLFVIAVLASPAVLANGLDGENGALTAALLVGGFGLLDRRPLLAGVLFGLLTIKPQLGILVPAALIAGRYYRTIVVAVLTALALVLASALAFGAQSWVLFFSRTRPWMQHLLTLPPEHQLYQMMMPTGFMTARNTGFSLHAAAALQVVLTLAAMVWVWRLWARPAADRQLRLALSLVLVMLATPFGYNYDMSPVAIGAALLVTRGLQTRSLPGESVAFAAWILPGIIVVLNFLAVGLLAPAALLGLAACLQRRLGVAVPAMTRPT